MAPSNDEPRWVWTLANGERVHAVIDSKTNDEVVSSSTRELSRASRGSKPQGHVLPIKVTGHEHDPIVVKFEPHAAICVLRIGNEELIADSFPLPRRVVANLPKRAMPIPLGGVFLVALVVALAGSAFAISRADIFRRSKTNEQERALNGRFIVHFPGTFVIRHPSVPTGMSAILLEHRDRSDAVVLVALPWEDVTSDPWSVHKQLHAEALAMLPRANGTFEETSRKDETCLGARGAATIGRGTTKAGDPSRIWSCAFVHDGGAYLALYQLRSDATADEERTLRAVVEATELTHLAELPPASITR